MHFGAGEIFRWVLKNVTQYFDKNQTAGGTVNREPMLSDDHFNGIFNDVPIQLTKI